METFLSSAESFALNFLESTFDKVEIEPRAINSRIFGLTGRLTLMKREYACVLQTSMPRADRLLPQLSLALLQARQRSGLVKHAIPFPVVVVERATLSLLLQVRVFASQYLAKDEALAVLSMDGASCIIGDGIDELSVKPLKRSVGYVASTTLNLFSDTHQWLLKVLLSEHFPEDLLTAKRGPFTSGRQLAEAADVSPVTANRFLQLLKEMRFLDSTNDIITVIRHKDLFLRWRAAANASRNEVPIRFLWRSDLDSQLQCVLEDQNIGGILGLFGAAQAMGLGHVSGVQPYVYVPKLTLVHLGEGPWESMTACPEGVMPDFFLRQAPAPISISNGSVRHGDMRYTDVIQTWLDVSYHPSRGQEQANLIHKKYLRDLFEPHLS